MKRNTGIVSYQNGYKKVVSLLLVISLIMFLFPIIKIETSAMTSADFSISENGISFICAREGFHATCYSDYSQSSIGYGTKCTGSSTQPHASGLHSITKSEAMAQLKSKINSTYAPRVRKQTSGITMNQNQFDALVSLCFNTGGGNTIISDSALVKYLKGELSESEARSQYSKYYIKAGGKVLQGLINRRNAEADLFFSGLDPIYISENPDDYPYPSRNLYYTSPVMTGNDVKWVQAVLRKLGYTVAIDGSYGPGTRDTVKQFQSDYGLSADGKAGMGETQPKLKEAWERLKNNNNTSRTTKISIWASEYGKGYTSEEATKVSQGVTLKHYYLWYKIYDENTGELYEQYGDKKYKATLYWQYSDGGTVYSSSYDNSSCNWIGVTPIKADNYKLRVVLSGDFTIDLSFDFNVSYDCSLSPSTDNVSLNLNGTNTASIRFTPTGAFPGDRGITWSNNNEIVSASSGGWSDDSSYFTLNLTGLKRGSTDYTVSLYENYTGNKEIVATSTIHINVSGNSYTISYNANGGYNAPSSQIKDYGTDITLSSVLPKKSYTITYSLDEDTNSSTSKTVYCSFVDWNTKANGLGTSYAPGEKYIDNSDVTLYAQWTNPVFGSNANPTRTGYKFDGWFTSATGGTRLTENSVISANTTVYAHWIQDATEPSINYGDVNSDGAVNNLDRVYLTRYLANWNDYKNINLNAADVDRDGSVNNLDRVILTRYLANWSSYSTLPYSNS